MRKAQLEIVGQVVAILVGLVALGNSDAREFYTRTVRVPVWVFVVGIVGIWFVGSWIRRRKASAPNTASSNPPAEAASSAPIRVEDARPHSAVPISSAVIESTSGGIALWVWLDPFGLGIRKAVNNRYLVAHASNRGNTREIDGEKRYLNVFALSSTPTGGGLTWRVWISNGRGLEFYFNAQDSDVYTKGWHHFAVRWDRAKPILELLIDGRVVADSGGRDYVSCWPQTLEPDMLVGTWPNRGAVHFVNTHVWRVRVFTAWPGEGTIREEIRRRVPSLPDTVSTAQAAT